MFQILIYNCFKYCIFEHYIAYLNYLITVFTIYMHSVFSSYACGGFFTQLSVKIESSLISRVIKILQRGKSLTNGKCTHGYKHTGVFFACLRATSFYTYAEKCIFIFLGLSIIIFKLIWFLLLRKKLICNCENKNVKGWILFVVGGTEFSSPCCYLFWI